jgi:hypothetical protein
MSALTIDSLITTLRAASDAQFLTFMQLLNDRGIPLFHAAEATMPEPVVPEVAVPVASAYRVCAADIDHATCVGRSLKGGEDKRWKPIIYRESQCGKKTVDGADLCTICTKREAKYDGKAGAWTGRITEEPPGWLHMLGTAWATDKPPVFNASASVSSASSSASSVADSDSDSESKAASKAAAKAEKAAAAAAAKAAKDAEKAAEKAAAKAAKDAEKAAEKAEKAAAAAAEKEAKAAAKAIKDAAAAVTAAAKKVVPKPKEE